MHVVQVDSTRVNKHERTDSPMLVHSRSRHRLSVSVLMTPCTSPRAPMSHILPYTRPPLSEYTKPDYTMYFEKVGKPRC